MLTSFWLTFPDEPTFPLGVGVTAHSLDDAFHLLEAVSVDFHRRARRVDVREGVSVAELDQNHVVANMGPIVVRGVWYPFIRIGT